MDYSLFLYQTQVKEYKNNLKEDISESEINSSENLSEIDNQKLGSVATQVKAKEYIPRSFEDYLPLEQVLYDQICSRTEKEYRIEFVSQLLEKLSLQYQQHRFHTNSAFVKYMAKALDFELIPDFRKDQRIEKYLSTIECDRRTDRVTILKKQIAALFSREAAYILLSSFNFPKHPSKSKYLIKRFNLLAELELTSNEEKLLLEFTKNVFGEGIESVEIIEDIENISITDIATIEEDFVDNCHEASTGTLEEQSSDIWRRARVVLAKRFGQEADKSWFCKLCLTDQIAENNHVLILAPSPFIRDYVKTNYYHYIRDAIQMVDSNIVDIQIMAKYTASRSLIKTATVSTDESCA